MASVENSSYDGFISYSHAADDLLAPRLQAGLQRFAKPWWKRRALRIFRDESSLSANPHLWSSITEALDGSEWFVLLLSEDAAASEWVNQEISYWVEHKDPSRILPVVTDGDFGWDNNDIDVSSTAAPPALSGVFVEEPRWVDLRWARTDTDLDLSNPRFSDAVADVASAIRGIPKDELESEEVRQHRRTIRTAWAAGVVVLLLGVAAAIGAVVAVGQSNEAQDQRDEAQRQAEIADEQRGIAEEQTRVAEDEKQNALDAQAEAETARDDAQEAQQKAVQSAEEADTQRVAAESSAAEANRQAAIARAEELAAKATTQIDVDPELGVLLALESLRIADTGSGAIALRQALHRHRTLFRIEVPDSSTCCTTSGIHPDGNHIVSVHGAQGLVEMWDATSDSSEPVWKTQLSNGGGEWDSVNELSLTLWFGVESVAFSISNRPYGGDFGGVFVLSTTTGEIIDFVEIGGCFFGIAPMSETGAPDGPVVLEFVAEGDEPGTCATPPNLTFDRFVLRRDGLYGSDEAVVLSGVPRLYDAAKSVDGGQHVVFGTFDEAIVVDTATGETVTRFEPGPISLSPDGSKALLRGVNAGHMSLRDVESGELLMVFPGENFRGEFIGDGSRVAIMTFEGPVRVFDTETGTLIHELRGPGSRPWALAHTEDPSLLLVETGEDTRLWTLADIITEVDHPYVGLGPIPVADSRESDIRVAGGLIHVAVTGGYRLFDAATGELVRESNTAWTNSRLSPDGTLVAQIPLLASDVEGPLGGPTNLYGPLEVVDAVSGEVVRVFSDSCGFYEDPVAQRNISERGPDCSDGQWIITITDMEFSADGRFLAIDGHAATPTVLEVATGATVWRGQEEVETARSIAISADGSVVVFRKVWSDDFALVAVDVATGEELGTATQCNPNNQMLFSDDGSLLYTANWCSDLVVFDTTTWEEVLKLKRGQGGALFDLAVSGSRAATVGADDMLRVWDLETQEVVLEVELAQQTFNVEFLDEDRLLVVANTGEAAVFTLNTGDLIGIATSRLTRGFREGECATYGVDPCPTLDEIRKR